MLRVFGRDKSTPLDRQIAVVLHQMQAAGPTSDEYEKLLPVLERLYKLKDKDRSVKVSRDTLALVAGNLLGIVLIVVYEQKHVMTSKGFIQLIRPRTQ